MNVGFEDLPNYHKTQEGLLLSIWVCFVAAAAIAGVNYLLTQNCKHIANAHELPRVYRLLEDQGYDQLLICTPTEFLGGDDNDKESDT